MSYSRKQMAFMSPASVSNIPLLHQCFIDILMISCSFSCILLEAQGISCLYFIMFVGKLVEDHVGHNQPRPFASSFCWCCGKCMVNSKPQLCLATGFVRWKPERLCVTRPAKGTMSQTTSQLLMSLPAGSQLTAQHFPQLDHPRPSFGWI